MWKANACSHPPNASNSTKERKINYAIKVLKCKYEILKYFHRVFCEWMLISWWLDYKGKEKIETTFDWNCHQIVGTRCKQIILSVWMHSIYLEFNKMFDSQHGFSFFLKYNYSKYSLNLFAKLIFIKALEFLLKFHFFHLLHYIQQLLKYIEI